MNVVQGEEITLGTTDPVKIILTDVPFSSPLDFFIKVTTATTGVKIGIDAVVANAKAWGTSDIVPPYCGYNGHLIAQGAATDKIIVTASPAAR